MICKWFKSKKKKVILEHTNFLQWQDSEVLIFGLLNDFRWNNSIDRVSADDNMLRLASKRTSYWIEVNNTVNLHWEFLGHRKPYLDGGYERISENATYGFTNIFRAWENSDSHRDNMLGDWKYCGISVCENSQGKIYACMILGK